MVSKGLPVQRRMAKSVQRFQICKDVTDDVCGIKKGPVCEIDARLVTYAPLKNPRELDAMVARGCKAVGSVLGKAYKVALLQEWLRQRGIDM